jgi:hypothetical protein
MPKRTSTLPIALAPPAAGVPLCRWLYDELRGAAADGRLRPGVRLPASRNLAAELQVARGTVAWPSTPPGAGGHGRKCAAGISVRRSCLQELR